jgi:hypothetical protein
MNTTKEWRPAFWALVWTVAVGYFLWSDAFNAREKTGVILVYLVLLGTVIFFYVRRSGLWRKGGGNKTRGR